MSVEKQTSGATSEASTVEVETNCISSTGSGSSCSLGEDASHTEVVSDSSVETAGVPSGLRGWLEPLPANELPGILGFADKEFLVTLVNLLVANSPLSDGSKPSVVGESVRWNAMISNTDVNKSMSADEADRIQPSNTSETKGDGGSSKTSTRGNDGTSVDDLRIQRPVESEGSLSEEASEFMGLLSHLAVVFPDGTPVVTIQTGSYESAYQVLSILDKVAKSLFQEEFLADQSLTWRQRLTNSGQLPIYALLLARIEQAILESYNAREGTTLAGNTLVHSQAIKKALNEANVHKDLAASIDSGTVDEIVRPFYELCLGGDHRADTSVSAVSLTPLEWLVQAKRIHGDIPFDRLDGAASKAIAQIESAGKEAAKPSEETEETTGDAAQNVSPATTPKKKKKRKRARKNKERKEAPLKAAANDTAEKEDSPPSNEVNKPQERRNEAEVSVDSAGDRERNRKKPQAQSNPTPKPGHTLFTVNATPASLLYLSDDSDDDSDRSEKSSLADDVKPEAAEGIPVPSSLEVNDAKRAQTEEQGETKDTDDAWETVEVKSRANRKKATDRNQPRNGNRGSSQNQDSQKKNKGQRAGAGRKRGNNSNKKQQASATDAPGSERISQDPAAISAPSTSPTRPSTVNAWGTAGNTVASEQPSTMRDVLLGKRPVVSKEVIASKAANGPTGDTKKRGKSPSTADQNTAPTFQETVSASSNAVTGRKTGKNPGTRAGKNGSSTGDSDDAPQNRIQSSPKQEKGAPVPTLLSPRTATSSTSSVASSLEAPHSLHRHRHSGLQADSNDVGYHLLDVCDRLSRDMGLFMGLRAQALTQRRQERASLLASLQQSVGKLWPDKCSVRLYGSCATQLDLPSSDLDVVVVGLGGSEDRRRKNGGKDGPKAQYPCPSPNAERIKMLGAELEGQPWAVRVNAIPTASVPVVKVLADPSRLDGSRPSQEASDGKQTESNPGDNGRQHMLQTWRGADVMNGLLSFDITFEGREHGGIGSTDYSSRVVDDACKELGTTPDGTPLVQVLMVLKELLAQRKLNEPYSGGLSSYALLLLVVALIKERERIRDEVERAERYRRAVTGGNENSNKLSSTKSDPAPKMKTVSSWAAIAKNKSGQSDTAPQQVEKPASFAAAASRSTETGARQPNESQTTLTSQQQTKQAPSDDQVLTSGQDSSLATPMFQQGYNDVIEVLCSGEPTAGKLLMHFFLHYGQYFDAQTTAIDVTGKHATNSGMPMFTSASPFIPRTSAGTIDPITGMLTVDPIVIYDTLEGDENNNVAKRCFLWSSIKWIFAQSYSTLSSMVERNNSPPSSPVSTIAPQTAIPQETTAEQHAEEDQDGASFDLMDPSSPILRSLLSF